jgi:AraC-like DNA-binding protein
MNLSPGYLSDLLRKNTGKSALAHIRLRLIDNAKDKLLDKTLSVRQIAYNLGFDYPQYLSRLFKQYTNLTPNEFRKQD